MRRCFRRLACGGIMGAVAVLAADEARAQRPFGLGSWEGELEFGLELGRQDTKAGEGSSSHSSRTRYEERLGVRNLGSFLLDPRLVTSNLGATVGLFEEDGQIDRRDSSRSGTLLGYSLDSVILSDKPYTFTLFTNRSQSVLSREFGGRSEISFENRGGTFRLREDSILQDLGIPSFTVLLGARQELTKEETTVLGQTFRRDEIRTVLSSEGNKGFETSDLNLRYELTDLDDRENPIANFHSHAASLTYSLDFGPTLNRRWDSRLDYLARTGTTPTTFLSADEELRLDHHEDLFTDYRYLFSRSETEGAGGATQTHTGIALLQQRLWKSLTTRLQADGTFQDFPTGERTRYAGQAELRYRRSIPWRGQAFAGTGARYQVDDNRFKVARVDVVDEPHTAPVPLGGGGGFTLANPFVIPGTIVVVEAGGLPTTPGVDYVIVQEGNFTKIIPLPTSLLISPGEALRVSYAFEVDQSLKFSTLSRNADAGVDFGWIAVSLSREESEPALLGGRAERSLEDRRVDTARLDLRGDWERLQAVATARFQIQESTRLEFTTRDFGQFLSYRALFDIALRLNAQETFTEFTLPRRRSQTYSIRGDVDWLPPTGLFLTTFLGFRSFQDSQLPTETVREAGLRGRWSYGKLELTPTFTWSERTRGPTETTDRRLELRVIRRF